MGEFVTPPGADTFIINRFTSSVDNRSEDSTVDLKPTLDLSNDLEVLDSIRNFSGKVNREIFSNLVENYLKPGATITPDQISFLSAEVPRDPEYRVITQDKGVFAYDSSFAWILQYEPKGGYTFGDYRNYPGTLYMSVVAFTYGDHLEKYLSRQKLSDEEAPRSEYPVIHQIQGPNAKESEPTYPNDPRAYGIAREALNQLAWEPLSIAIVHEWAKANSIPTLQVLPAKYNYWVKGLPGQDPKVQRFNMRYDKTAKNYGFTKQPNGLYGLDVRNTPSPLEVIGRK